MVRKRYSDEDVLRLLREIEVSLAALLRLEGWQVNHKKVVWQRIARSGR